jgi:predicted RNA-binding Zn ribbon-like protein
MDEKKMPSLQDIALQLDAPDVLASGKLCLEFTNTLNWHASANPTESLHSYNDLINWAAGIGLLTEQTAGELKSQAAKLPALAEQVYTWAIDLREAIYRLFVAIASEETPSAEDLALLNEALPYAYSRPQVVSDGSAFTLQWRGDESGLDSVLWPILRSTVRLLTEGEHSRIGQCEDDRGCGYLFYDTSRNRSRRWCDMNSCGNRAKSQRHYARHRNAATAH